MGCCVSSPTVSDKNTSPSPSVVEEKTVVNEVLSKTTLLTTMEATTTTTETILEEEEEEEEKKPGVTDDVAEEPVLTKPGLVKPEKGTEACSEMCSLSESLLSIVNGYDEEEVKQKIPQMVRQRSPAKSRNRVMVTNPTRRTDMSPRRRNNDEGTGFGSGKSDPTERSERRSRSPAVNRSAVMGGGGAMRRQSQSPGRVRLDPSRNGSELDCRYQKWPGGSEARGNYNSTPDDSLENPLVSLECFIFL